MMKILHVLSLSQFHAPPSKLLKGSIHKTLVKVFRKRGNMIKVLYENVFTEQGVFLEIEVLLIKSEEQGGQVMSICIPRTQKAEA